MENILFIPSALIFAASLTTGAYFMLFVFRAKPPVAQPTDALPDVHTWKLR
jgi:hypothetical protein